jgi:site-specific recombinase XerD
MTNTIKFGSWVRRFLLEHLVNERNLARNTQRSYRDTLVLLIPFLSRDSAYIHWLNAMSKEYQQRCRDWQQSK